MKIKAKNPKIASIKLCVPFDGVIDIDANGVVEVSPKCAVQLVTGTNDWEYVKKAGVADPVIKEQEEESEEEEEEEEDIDYREEFEKGLKTMTVIDMKAMAKEAEYPEAEWTKLSSKKIMSAYLLKKFDEAGDEEK